MTSLGVSSIHNSGIISGYNEDAGDAMRRSSMDWVFKKGTRRTDQHHHLGSHELFLFLVGSLVDSPGLHVGYARGYFVLRRIRRVFRVMDLLSHVFRLRWVFVWGVWVGAYGEDWDCFNGFITSG